MYKDLSLKEKAKVIREGVRLGLNSIDDIQSLYDEAISYQQGGPIVSPYGQWKYPGRDTIIPSNNITMDYIDYPVLGISDTGDAKVMMPWNDYKFKGSMVYEHPLVSNQFQLGGLAKPFSYGDIPDVRYQKGGNLFQERGFINRIKPIEEYITPLEPVITDNTAIVQNPVYTPQEKSYAAAQQAFYERHKSPEAEKKASREARQALREDRQAVKNQKAAEFGTLDTPQSSNLQYAWRRFNNSKGSELLYLLPVIGETMFGVDVADKLYSGNYGDAAKDLALYGAMTYAPELLSVLKNGYNKVFVKDLPFNNSLRYRGLHTDKNPSYGEPQISKEAIEDAKQSGYIRSNDKTYDGPYFSSFYNANFYARLGKNPILIEEIPNSGIRWVNPDKYSRGIIEDVKRIGDYAIPYYNGSTSVPSNLFTYWQKHPIIGWRQYNFNKGGSIHIKPENRGKFTALKKRTGHPASWFKAHGTPAQKKMATFALNSRHWKHQDGGHLFQEAGQTFKRPQDDLTRRNILTSPILPPKSYYEQSTIPELEPKKPQPLQPIEGTYGNKYSELVPMSDGTYVNNPINKGLQQDWRTFGAEIALPFMAAAGPAIGSTATWLASKPALYNLGRMTLGSEIGGRGVDLASQLFTGNTWGQNVGNVVEGITGWNPNNTMVGQFITDATNPGNYFDLSRLWKTGLATSPLVTRRNSIRQTNTQTNNSGSDFDIEDARNMFRSFEPDYTPSQSSGYRISQNETPRELLEDLENLIDHNIHGTYNRTDTPRIIHILEDIQNDANIHINPSILTTQAKFPSLTSRYRNFIENNQTFGPMLSRLKYTLNDYSRLKPNLRKGQIEDSGHILWGILHKPQDGKDITGLSYFNMSPKNAVERAKRDMARIPVGSRFILDYADATSHNSYPLSLHMMNSYVSPNFNVKPSKFFGLQRMIPLNDMGFATDDVLKSTNRNITRLNKDRGLKLPQAYLKNGTVFVPAVYAERIYDIGGYINDLIPYYSW